MTNRRCFDRMALKKRVMLGVCDSYFFAETINVSENGIAVKSAHIFPPRSKISLQSHTASEVIMLDGVVVWSNLNVMGIRLNKTIHEFERQAVH